MEVSKRPKLKKIHRDRLNKLASFLEKLKPKQFDFSDFVTRIVIDSEQNLCGSVCCALGWCPKVFPKNCRWRPKRPDFQPDETTFDVQFFTPLNGRCLGRVFFDMSREEYEEIFYHAQLHGNWYVDRVKSKDVARAIRVYVKVRS